MPSSRGSACLLHWQVGSLPLAPPGKPPQVISISLWPPVSTHVRFCPENLFSPFPLPPSLVNSNSSVSSGVASSWSTPRPAGRGPLAPTASPLPPGPGAPRNCSDSPQGPGFWGGRDPSALIPAGSLDCHKRCANTQGRSQRKKGWNLSCQFCISSAPAFQIIFNLSSVSILKSVITEIYSGHYHFLSVDLVRWPQNNSLSE